MELSADVLIIAREYDRVAIRLRSALEKRGCCVAQLDGPSAARIFTIRVQPGSTSVVPSIPMFVRASAWWSDQPPQTRDDIFQRNEEYSTFWAATALSPTPVINRPSRNGGAGRMTWGAIASTLNLVAGPGGSEIFASGPELISPADDTMWGEDANYISAPLGKLQAGVPVRARKVSPGALYEIITVVGKRAFSATNDPRTAELDLLGRSLALAPQAEAHFATITWAIDDAGATPVRLNTDPEETEVRYSWNEVSDALCEDLMQ